MNIEENISAGLISTRNILLEGRVNKFIIPTLQDVLLNTEKISVDSTKKIIIYCVAEAINQINNSDFISAARVINLVHNLPLNKTAQEKWRIDYFLSVELFGFLENFDEIKSAREITLFVSGELSKEYL